VRRASRGDLIETSMKGDRVQCKYLFERSKDGASDTDIFVISSAGKPAAVGPADLLVAETVPCRGNCIAKLASSMYWVPEDRPLKAIVDALAPHTELFAIGVVEESGEALGVIVRRELFDLLGSEGAEGRLEKMTARSLTRYVKAFSPDASVFAVYEAISREMRSVVIQYFLVKDKEGLFRGVFSTKDMLIFMSETHKRDIALVRDFQVRLIRPQTYFADDGIEFCAFSQPAMEAGGDYYALKKRLGSTYFVLTADVSGKGVGAAFFTAVCASITDTFDFSRGLAAWIRTLNRYYNRTYSSTGSFMTCVAYLYDARTGEVTACDLGHSYFYLMREGSIRQLRLPDNAPIGIEPEIAPRISRFTIDPGDALVTVTDGLIEQSSGRGEGYTIERLHECIKSLGSFRELRKTVLADLSSFRGFQHQHDDVTVSICARLP
jgi:phosphoserine phosphatase RsbU/P